MGVNVIKDIDLYDHLNEYDCVLIGTNSYYAMSQGLQLQVMLNYPYVWEENLKTKYADPEKMGTVIKCESKDEPTFCLCFITYGCGYRPDLEKDYLSYESLEKCLKLVNILYKGKKVASPVMGMFKWEGNGDKAKILEIFKKNITDVDLDLYDYRQKTRAEQLKEVWLKEKEVKEKDRKAYYAMVKKRKEEAEERFKRNGHRRY